MNAIHNVFMLHDASKYACLRLKLFVYSKYTMYVLVLYCIFMNRVDIPYSRSDIHIRRRPKQVSKRVKQTEFRP